MMMTGTLELQSGRVHEALAIERRAFPHPWSLADFEWVAQDDDTLKVGLWHEACLAGYAFGVVEGRGFHLASLAVDAPFRRRGWGSQLLAAILDRARQRDCRTCRLEVRRSNAAALQLYRKFGFHVSGLRQRFYSRPVEDAWLLTRDLAAGPGPMANSSTYSGEHDG